MEHSKDNKIYIDSDYCFEIDGNCITLSKRRVTKKGKVQFDTVGYYTSLEAMLYRILETGLADCRNLQDIVDRQIELKKTIADMLEKAAVAISQTGGNDKIQVRISS